MVLVKFGYQSRYIHLEIQSEFVPSDEHVLKVSF